MQQPVKGNPIPRQVEIKTALVTLYREGKLSRGYLERALMSGRISREDYFRITGDTNIPEQ